MVQKFLTPDERDAIRNMRVDELLTYEEIGERLGVDRRTVQGIVERDDYQPNGLNVLRINRNLKQFAPVPAKRTGTRG
jgi:DNA-binding XRE family transcriptional regulator